MKYEKPLSVMVYIIVLLALIATLAGLFSKKGPETYLFNSIYGEEVLIYGKGIYRSMSALDAPDGIAQDIVTLILAVPLLRISFGLARKGSLKWRLVLAGVLLYFLFTYLLYMVFIMYNELFLVYVLLTSLSFYAFVLTMLSFDLEELSGSFDEKLAIKLVGVFLILSPVL